jgi:disulfide bond formation protein DsbB
MLARARLLALALPAVLLGGALGSQYLGGLVPCEMCMWQRYPLYAALVAAILAFALARTPLSRLLTLIAGLLIIGSGGIGLWQAGAEYHWWKGPEHCTSLVGGSGADLLKAILAAPLIRCDQPQWTLFGISLAGFNALFSTIGGLAVLILCQRPSR